MMQHNCQIYLPITIHKIEKVDYQFTIIFMAGVGLPVPTRFYSRLLW